MKILKTIIFLYVLFFSAQALCQESLPSLPIFKTLCVDEKATGFNWKSGDWVQGNFMPSKWLIQKIKIPNNRQNKIDMEYGKCTDEIKIKASETMTGSESCYSVRRFGSESVPFINNEMCVEHFENNKLKAIYCKNIIFKPDGNFVMKPHGPTIDIIENNPENNYKDSLVLSVGKCSKIE